LVVTGSPATVGVDQNVQRVACWTVAERVTVPPGVTETGEPVNPSITGLAGLADAGPAIAMEVIAIKTEAPIIPLENRLTTPRPDWQPRFATQPWSVIVRLPATDTQERVAG